MMHLESPKPKQKTIGVMMRLLLAIIILISFTPSYVWAQESKLEPQKVIAIHDGEFWFSEEHDVIECILEVWNVGAAGGDAYAEAIYYCKVDGEFLPDAETIYGTFSGGSNGVGTVSGDDVTLDFEFIDGKEVQITPLYCGDLMIVQNPDAFVPSQAVPITSEYIYTTYGISVEDSFGDDQWEQKSWSDQELILLNDVLKELPPGLLKEMAVTRIIRNKVNIDANGNPRPNDYGIYFPCGSPPEKDCTSSSGTIRIFDAAKLPLDFSNDPNGYKEFKGTILHEFIHALQYKKDENSIYKDPQNWSYKNPHSSPLVLNYMDATRPITDINDPGFEGTNGWAFGRHPPGSPVQKWKLFNTQDNKPPTNYGNTNPLEDMSESVMLYMYEPQKLKDSSPQRYNFIRDQIFEGVEYENGTQKKP